MSRPLGPTRKITLGPEDDFQGYVELEPVARVRPEDTPCVWLNVMDGCFDAATVALRAGELRQLATFCLEAARNLDGLP